MKVEISEKEARLVIRELSMVSNLCREKSCPVCRKARPIIDFRNRLKTALAK